MEEIEKMLLELKNTSELMVDRSLESDMGDFNPTGVNEVLVRRVRDALDVALVNEHPAHERAVVEPLHVVDQHGDPGVDPLGQPFLRHLEGLGGVSGDDGVDGTFE